MNPAQSLATKLHSIDRIRKALVQEASMRSGKTYETWQLNEAMAVHREACKIAGELGLREPTLDEIRKAETEASGHSDYARKWALYAFELTLQEPQHQPTPQ